MWLSRPLPEESQRRRHREDLERAVDKGRRLPVDEDGWLSRSGETCPEIDWAALARARISKPAEDPEA